VQVQETEDVEAFLFVANIDIQPFQII
jgi:hypothetical protein